MSVTIDLTQNMVALQKAHRTRHEMVELRQSIRDAQHPKDFVAFILDSPLSDAAGALPIRRLLLAIPRFGEARLTDCLSRACISTGDRKVRDITQRQRHLIARMLRGEEVEAPIYWQV